MYETVGSRPRDVKPNGRFRNWRPTENAIYRVVFRGDLAAIEGHAADPRGTQIARQVQHLIEQPAQGRELRLAKLGDLATIRLIAGREQPERDVFDQAVLNLPRRKHPSGSQSLKLGGSNRSCSGT